MKNNIQPLTDANNIISQINPVTYDFDQAGYPSLSLPSGNQVGLLAEEVYSVLPNLVRQFSTPAEQDSLGNMVHPSLAFSALNYTGLIPVLLQGLKEQQELLYSISLQLAAFSQQLINCGVKTEQTGYRSNITLSNQEAIVLDQNVPNPFADQTEISYSIPVSINEAKLIFYDQAGKIIKVHLIEHRGIGIITVYGEDLSSGIYSYSLVLDGKSFETKRMVKQ